MSSFSALIDYGPLLLKGLLVTLGVGLSAMILAILFGLLGAIAKRSKYTVIRFLAESYTLIIRGVPELITILLIYYGVPMLFASIGQYFGYSLQLNFNPFVAGFVTIGFIYGAFATEVFRGAFAAVYAGQIEAARSVGLSKIQTFVRIELPQAMRYSLPGLANVWMVLIKATSLISVISLYEIVNYARVAINNTSLAFTFYFAISLVFLLITILSVWAQKYIENHNKRTGFLL